MTDDEYRDFVDEMYVAVQEEQPLHEVPAASIDREASGDIAHGPWSPEDCSRVLLGWHAAGLLALYRYDEDGSPGADVADGDAAVLLGDPQRWTPPNAFADVVALVVTERGAALAPEEWRAQAGRGDL